MKAGTDSYVSLEEANAYVTTFYGGSDTEACWTGKSDDAKELLLVSACADLERLPFTGRKTSPQQALSFPRYPSQNVPACVKSAQIETALIPLRDDVQKRLSEQEQRTWLQNQGVVSFSLGKLSESYGKEKTNRIAMQYPFMSDMKIARLISCLLNGGYETC